MTRELFRQLVSDLGVDKRDGKRNVLSSVLALLPPLDREHGVLLPAEYLPSLYNFIHHGEDLLRSLEMAWDAHRLLIEERNELIEERDTWKKATHDLFMQVASLIGCKETDLDRATMYVRGWLAAKTEGK